MFRRRYAGLLAPFMRMIIGLGLLAWSTTRLISDSRKRTDLFLAIIGAMKVGEGLFHFLLFRDLARGLENLHDEPQLKRIIDIVVPEDEPEAEQLQENKHQEW